MEKKIPRRGRYPCPFNSHPPRSLGLRVRNKRRALLKGLVKAQKGSNALRPIWNPTFVLSIRDPLTSKAILRDALKGRLGLVPDCVELKDMRKHKVFLSLKRDLAKVRFFLLHLTLDSLTLFIFK